MDPTETLDDLLTAIDDCDDEAAHEHADPDHYSQFGWIEPPTLPYI